MSTASFDVIVVGAGAAGCYAADLLKRKSPSLNVLLLEASNRVGGRTESIHFRGHRIDIGGQWIGPENIQPRVNKLIKEFGLHTHDQHCEGKGIYLINNKLHSFAGDMSSGEMSEFPDYAKAWNDIDKMAQEIDPSKPWDHPRAHEYDAITLAEWLKPLDKNSASLHASNFRSLLAAEPSEVSLLNVLLAIKTGIDYKTISDANGAAQHATIVGGYQQISENLAKRFQSKGGQIFFNGRVTAVVRKNDKYDVVAMSSQGNSIHFETHSIIIAVPTPMTHRINFFPPLPHHRDGLAQRTHMGAMIKCIVVYEKPFWRENGFSGEIFTDSEPVVNYYDECFTHSDRPFYAIVGLMGGSSALKYSKKSQQERKEAVISQLVKAYGLIAQSPIDYIDKDWTSDEFARGAYYAISPPHVVSVVGHTIRSPIGRLFWCGTETADNWSGHVEGALQSAERVSDEVLHSFKSSKL